MEHDTFVGPWVLSTSLIAAMREEGIISDSTIEKLLRNMRSDAERYAAAHHPAAAGEIRRNADELERHFKLSGAG